jgi:predicted lipoprotein with Yx(FWY)xxD motif
MRRLIILCFAVAVAATGLIAVTASGASRADVKTRKTDLGRILVDSKGRTLYLFEKDSRNKSRCSGQCAKVWPIAYASGKATAAGGVKSSQLKTIKRSNGKRQLTYFGHPLYRVAPDGDKPGVHKGQGVDGFGAEWYVLGTNGKKIE